MAAPNKCCDSVRYELRLWKPVNEVTHIGLNRQRLRDASNKTSSRAESPIKTPYQHRWKASKCRATVVNSTGDRSMNESHTIYSRVREGTSNNTDLTM